MLQICVQVFVIAFWEVILVLILRPIVVNYRGQGTLAKQAQEKLEAPGI